uniref:Uncharacterized protein n=1 Tax=Knipowitschia caucasica TaxID=637954 RepID=A0AAV2M8E0_KNICA
MPRGEGDVCCDVAQGASGTVLDIREGSTEWGLRVCKEPLAQCSRPSLLRTLPLLSAWVFLHHHLFVLYSGLKATAAARPSTFAHQVPQKGLPYTQSGSHFPLEGSGLKLDPPEPFSRVQKGGAELMAVAGFD